MLKFISQDLWLWLTGWPHLWSGKPHGRKELAEPIFYRDGWGPWKFALFYLTTYLGGTLAGYGVVSLSRAWYDRSLVESSVLGNKKRYPFAALMTRILDALVPGAHGALTGPWLWGTASHRNMMS